MYIAALQKKFVQPFHTLHKKSPNPPPQWGRLSPQRPRAYGKYDRPLKIQEVCGGIHAASTEVVLHKLLLLCYDALMMLLSY